LKANPIKHTIRDVTPKGYGPNEETVIEGKDPTTDFSQEALGFNRGEVKKNKDGSYVATNKVGSRKIFTSEKSAKEHANTNEETELDETSQVTKYLKNKYTIGVGATKAQYQGPRHELNRIAALQKGRQILKGRKANEEVEDIEEEKTHPLMVVKTPKESDIATLFKLKNGNHLIVRNRDGKTLHYGTKESATKHWNKLHAKDVKEEVEDIEEAKKSPWDKLNARLKTHGYDADEVLKRPAPEQKKDEKPSEKEKTNEELSRDASIVKEVYHRAKAEAKAKDARRGGPQTSKKRETFDSEPEMDILPVASERSGKKKL